MGLYTALSMRAWLDGGYAFITASQPLHMVLLLLISIYQQQLGLW